MREVSNILSSTSMKVRHTCIAIYKPDVEHRQRSRNVLDRTMRAFDEEAAEEAISQTEIRPIIESDKHTHPVG